MPREYSEEVKKYIFDNYATQTYDEMIKGIKDNLNVIASKHGIYRFMKNNGLRRPLEHTEICSMCGREYVSTDAVRNRKVHYCSGNCRDRARFLDEEKRKNHLERCKEYGRRKQEEKKRTRKKKKPESDLVRVVKEARDAGMTYGRYVGMMWQRGEKGY